MLSLYRKCRLLAAFPLLILSLSCQESPTETTVEELPAPQAVTYSIRKGSHSVSNNAFKRVSTAALRFEATFDSTAVYTTKDPVNQADINKLYGLSDCSADHHTNSARFGWRWYGNRLEIHAYTYHNKVRRAALLGTVALGTPSTYELQLKDGEYVFILDGKRLALPRACTGKGEGYQLYPYFGGDETAPHDISILIKELL